MDWDRRSRRRAWARRRAIARIARLTFLACTALILIFITIIFFTSIPSVAPSVITTTPAPTFYFNQFNAQELKTLGHFIFMLP